VVIGSPNGMVIMIIINQKKGGLWSQKYHRYGDVSDIFLIEWEINHLFMGFYREEIGISLINDG
jgi:hypothetical protein